MKPVCVVTLSASESDGVVSTKSFGEFITFVFRLVGSAGLCIVSVAALVVVDVDVDG